MNLLPALEQLQNVHPLFVHFPIALILVALFSEAVWRLSKKDHYRRFATYLIYLSSLSAVAAVITGYLASNSLGHDMPGNEFVHVHRNIMLWMSGLLVATTVVMLFVRSFREGNWRRLLIVPLLIISGLLIYGADKGGRLVFEYGMGVRAIPETSSEDTKGHEDEEEGTEKGSGHSTSDSSKGSEGHSDEHGDVDKPANRAQ
jgi:uncharacterized membrane protein